MPSTISRERLKVIRKDVGHGIENVGSLKKRKHFGNPGNGKDKTNIFFINMFSGKTNSH